MENKRKNVRTDLNAKLMLKKLSGNVGDADSEVIIDVTDLSKTGIGFSCDKLLVEGEVYEAYLTIWTKEVIHVFIEIVRKMNASDHYAYGGIFVGMSEMDACRISVYQTVESEIK